MITSLIVGGLGAYLGVIAYRSKKNREQEEMSNGGTSKETTRQSEVDAQLDFLKDIAVLSDKMINTMIEKAFDREYMYESIQKNNFIAFIELEESKIIWQVKNYGDLDYEASISFNRVSEEYIEKNIDFETSIKEKLKLLHEANLKPNKISLNELEGNFYLRPLNSSVQEESNTIDENLKLLFDNTSKEVSIKTENLDNDLKEKINIILSSVQELLPYLCNDKHFDFEAKYGMERLLERDLLGLVNTYVELTENAKLKTKNMFSTALDEIFHSIESYFERLEEKQIQDFQVKRTIVSKFYNQDSEKKSS